MSLFFLFVEGLKKHRRRLAGEKASVLIITLIISVVLVILSAGVLSLLSADARGTLQTMRLDSALNVAEAGAEEALWELNFGGADFEAGGGWQWQETESVSKTGTLQSSGGTAIGEYEISIAGPTGDSPTILVTGYVPSQSNPLAQRRIQVYTQQEETSDFTMAVFGTDQVIFDKEITTDSYDSRNGAYGPGNQDGSMGHVGTDSTDAGAISLAKDVVVNGNGIVGQGGNPDDVISLSGDAEITGDKMAAEENAVPQPKAAPTGLTQKADINAGKESPVTINSSGQYDTISLGKESVLTIDAAGGSDITIYVTGTFSLAKESELKITGDSNVKIYFGDAGVNINKEGKINNQTADPTQFGFYGTSDFTGTVSINKETDFYGTIYVPSGTVDLDKEMDVYGAVVADTVTVDKECKIHFDEALLDAGGGSGGSYAVAYWQEK